MTRYLRMLDEAVRESAKSVAMSEKHGCAGFMFTVKDHVQAYGGDHMAGALWFAP